MRTATMLALLLALALAACAAAVAETQATPTPATWRLDALRADAVILEAMHAGWPDKTPEPLGADAIGYSFVVHWASAADRVHAQARREADRLWSFRVWNTVAAPAAGDAARERLLGLIEAAARRAQDP